MSLRGAQRRGNLYPRWQPIIDRHASLSMTNQGNPRLLHCVRNDKGRKVRNDKGGKFAMTKGESSQQSRVKVANDWPTAIARAWGGH